MLACNTRFQSPLNFLLNEAFMCYDVLAVINKKMTSSRCDHPVTGLDMNCATWDTEDCCNLLSAQGYHILQGSVTDCATVVEWWLAGERRNWGRELLQSNLSPWCNMVTWHRTLESAVRSQLLASELYDSSNHPAVLWTPRRCQHQTVWRRLVGWWMNDA
jgi:hypothetical protein